MRESKVAEMKKNLKKCEQNQIRSKKSRENRKRKIDELDEETRLKITGKKDSSAPGRPQKEDKRRSH